MAAARMKKLTVTNTPTLSRVFPMCSSVYEQGVEQAVLHRGRARPPVEERAHLRMVHRADLVESPGGEHFAVMQHHGPVGDHLDAAQFVGDDDNRHVELGF